MTSTQGRLITLDGPCGVGKTTLASLLKPQLQTLGLRVFVTVTPSESAIGKLARAGTHEFHGTTLSCLVAADRYHHDQTVVQSEVARGSLIICDRHVPS